MASGWSCGLCLFACLLLSQMLSHIRQFHSGDEDFQITCGISNCEKSYNKFDSFYRHYVFLEIPATDLNDVGISTAQMCKQLKWVILYGTKYISNECSLIVWAENERPVFGDLLGVQIANGTDLLFRVAELETLGFNNTLNSFEVDKLGQAKSVVYIAPHNLLNHEIVHKWEVNNKLSFCQH